MRLRPVCQLSEGAETQSQAEPALEPSSQDFRGGILSYKAICGVIFLGVKPTLGHLNIFAYYK